MDGETERPATVEKGGRGQAETQITLASSGIFWIGRNGLGAVVCETQSVLENIYTH
jgi:hypothetical protein